MKVSAERRNGSICIVVTDSGTGIPEKVREKLFQPFFTTKEIGKGTGLGLSISRGILEAHHGSLSVDATCPNTRFIIQIPEAAAPVVLGMMLMAAERPPFQSFLLAPSTVFCVAV